MVLTRLLPAALLVLGASFAHGQQTAQSSVLGLWREPQGSMLSIHRCGPAGDNEVCAAVAGIRPNAPALTDIYNPDPALRNRQFCNLQIGSGFHLEDASHAEDGHLYDPRTGKTYSGSMHAEGATLHLRGYILVKLFGRTERWTRMPADTPTCTALPQAGTHALVSGHAANLWKTVKR